MGHSHEEQENEQGGLIADFFFYHSSYPANGSQKLIEIEDERKLRIFMEKRVRTCPYQAEMRVVEIDTIQRSPSR